MAASKSLKIAKKISNYRLKEFNNQKLSEAYKNIGDYKNALLTFQEYHKYYAINHDKEVAKKTQELKTKFEVERTEEENIVLKKDIEIQKLKNYMFLGGLIISVLIIIVFFRKYLYLLAFWKKKLFRNWGQKVLQNFRIKVLLG